MALTRRYLSDVVPQKVQILVLLNEMFFGARPWQFAPHIHAVHSETNTKAQKLPATLSTSGHWGT